jgi:hypothetical protein
MAGASISTRCGTTLFWSNEMNKYARLSLVLLACGFAALPPAQASESDDLVTKAVKVPVTVSALFAGMAVGTPIAIVHDTIAGYSAAREQVAGSFGGDSPDACQYLVADMVALPASLAVGLVDGTYHGISNAINNCSDKPFSAESFCLKDSCYSNAD